VGQAGGMPAIHRERAHAKLTRSLRITGRRDDGYHLLESEMVTLDFGDDLEIEEDDLEEPARRSTALEVVDEVAWEGRDVSVVASTRARSAPALGVPLGAENLVVKALRLVGRHARVRLVKRIPPGAGLGGGSADAAAVLRWAGIVDPALAVRLGADVPFCVVGGRALVTGVGEILQPLALDDATYLCCTPEFGVSTSLVYRAFDEIGAGVGMTNDLEQAALAVEPRLSSLRDLLGSVSGVRPVLAGSGSTWYVPCRAAVATRLRGEVAGAVLAEGRRVSLNVGRTVGVATREQPTTGA